MTESDERLEAVSDKIDKAQQAAQPLADQNVIDPDAVENDVASSGDEVTGPDDSGKISGPDVPDTDLEDAPDDARS